MQPTEIWNALSSVSTALTAGITLSAAYYASSAASSASAQAEILKAQIDAHRTTRLTEIHSRFQNEFRAIQRTLPHDVNSEAWAPTDDHKRSISLYWYLVFDEWLTCTKLSPDLNSLWEDHYSKGVMSALRLPAFRMKIEEIFSGESTFMGYGPEFRKHIDEICFDAIGKNLRIS